MADIIHRVGIACDVNQVYTALTTNEGLATWWTNEVTGAGDVGSILEFRFNGMGPDFKVTELIKNSLVRWSHYGNVPEDWMGTQISFKLINSDNQVLVLFCHANWSKPSDFMAHCSTKWAVFLFSLKKALETGKGRPFPDDVHIDHD